MAGAPLDGNHEVVEGLCTLAEPAGLTTRDACETLRDTILDQLRTAGPVDLVAFSMHGAMVAEGYPDREGDMLARAREIVGSDVALGAKRDLHCHLTETMLSAADVLVACRCAGGRQGVSHTDVHERAEEPIDLPMATARGDGRPHMTLADTEAPMLMHTTMEPVSGLVARMAEWEARHQVLSVSLGHGFPWGDVPDLGSRALIVTDDNHGLSRELAMTLAADAVAMRDRGQRRPPQRR